MQRVGGIGTQSFSTLAEARFREEGPYTSRVFLNRPTTARLRPQQILATALIATFAVVAAPPVAQAETVSVDLQMGWNNVSYHGEPLPVEEALGSAAPVIGGVWRWQATNAVWLAAFPDNPRISSLVALRTGAAYWLLSAQAVRWHQTAEVALLLEVQLADSTARRSRGLMFRQFLDDDAGMLFLFPAETNGGFWMRDTLLPLSIAFIDGEGVINEIRDLEPLDEAVVLPLQSYHWALEVNQGWFDMHGVEAGGRVWLTGS